MVVLRTDNVVVMKLVELALPFVEAGEGKKEEVVTEHERTMEC